MGRRVLIGLGIVAIGLATLIAVASAAPTRVNAPDPATTDSLCATEPLQSRGSSVADTAPPDPEADVLGWENGYWYNESIDVDQTDGLSEGELERVLGRTMARVEYLRGLEFTETPAITFVSRDGVERYVDRTVTQLPGGNATWEVLFVVGDDADARSKIRETILASAGGLAAEEGIDHVVLVTEEPDRPRVSGYVLAHELLHVLQDQHFDLSAPRYQRTTLDGELAKDGLVEGEASLVDGLYRGQCVNGEWTCLTGGLAPSSGPVTPAIGELLGVPYLDGATYVGALRERGGWDAVTSAHQTPPKSMKQVLHPDQPVDAPAPIEDTDRTGPGWSRSVEAQRIGEAGIRTMFRRQNSSRNVPLPVRTDSSGSDPPSAVATGWSTGALYPYSNGDQQGYIWVTEWESRTDARQFTVAYKAILESYDAEWTGDSTARITEGPFAGALAIQRTGTRVRITNAPDRTGLLVLSESLDTDGPTAGKATTASGPGFGVAVAILAVCLLAIGGRSSRQWL